MPKPIFIIQTNITISTLDGMRAYDEWFEKLKAQLNEYHVLVFNDSLLNEPKFLMFSDKEIEPIELEKLKEIVNVKTSRN